MGIYLNRNGCILIVCWVLSCLQDPGGQQIGFLLGSLGISVALTSDATAKGLPKEDGKDSIVHFKGWPRLTWFVTEHLPKPPKDWTPPPRPQPDTPAYIEVRGKEIDPCSILWTASPLLSAVLLC